MSPLDKQLHDAYLVVAVQQQILHAAQALVRNPLDTTAATRMRALLREPSDHAHRAIARLVEETRDQDSAADAERERPAPPADEWHLLPDAAQTIAQQPGTAGAHGDHTPGDRS